MKLNSSMFVALLATTLFASSCKEDHKTPIIPKAIEITEGKLTKYEDSKITNGSVSLGEDVEIIASNVFKGSEKLVSLTAEAVTKIEESACENAKALETVSLPKVGEIGSKAFAGATKLKSLTLGEKIPNVAADAFENTNTEKVLNVPEDQVTAYLGFAKKHGFKSINKTSLVGGALVKDGVLISFDKSALPANKELTLDPSIKKISDSSLQDLKDLKKIVAEGVTEIGKNAFELLPVLEIVEMPNLKTIGESAFERCPKLATFKAPKLETIGTNAFLDAASLKGFDLTSVKSIQEGAFKGVLNLDVTIGANKPSIAPKAFDAEAVKLNIVTTGEITKELREWALKNGFKTINGKPAKEEEKKIEKYPLPADAVTEEIKDGPYKGMRKLITYTKDFKKIDQDPYNNQITLPEDIAIIGKDCFMKRQSLSYSYVPLGGITATGVREIETGAFWGQADMSKFNMPNLEKIGDEALYYNRVKIFNFPKLKSIGTKGMGSLRACQELHIPSIEVIGNDAFIDSSKILKIFIGSNLSSIGKGFLDFNTFGVAYATEINYPKGIDLDALKKKVGSPAKRSVTYKEYTLQK